MTWRMMEKPRKETGRRNIRIATIAWRGMKAGARFTVSLFDWSCRAVWVCVVFLGGFCFVARLLFPYWTFIILDLSQISSSGYKNCHYRCDARSNGKKIAFEEPPTATGPGLERGWSELFDWQVFVLDRLWRQKKFCLIGFIDCDYRHDERKDWKKQSLSSKRQLQGDEFPATFKIRISSRISDLGHR